MNEEAGPAPDGDRYRSVAEFATAWDGLDGPSLVRLGKIAEVFRRPPLLGKDDLFQEVYLRVISGSRRWPVGVDLVKFMAETMRSIADEATKSAERARGLALVTGQTSGPEDAVGIIDRKGALAVLLRLPVTPEEGRITAEETAAEAERLRQWHEQLLALFEDDFAAQCMVEGMFEGLKGKKLQEFVGLCGTAFASKQRLVRRRIEKLGDEVRARRKQA